MSILKTVDSNHQQPKKSAGNWLEGNKVSIAGRGSMSSTKVDALPNSRINLTWKSPELFLLVAPAGIEPASSESESEILSIVLRSQIERLFACKNSERLLPKKPGIHKQKSRGRTPASPQTLLKKSYNPNGCFSVLRFLSGLAVAKVPLLTTTAFFVGCL